jgi:hypothetical protein
MESFLRDNFFQNPFGSGMNPMGGGGNGVLENIQQQVTDNGQALKSLQGGIGGLPSGNLPPGGIGGGHRGPGSPGTVKPSPIQGGFVPEPPPMMTGTPPTLGGMPPGYSGPAEKTEPQDPIPDFRSMITDSYKREGVDDAFFDSEFYLNTFDGGGMSGIFGGPEGQVAAMSKYFGFGGSNSARRDEAYENYLRATGQEDKIKTDHDYNDIGGGIFNLNDITQPTPGSSNFTPAPEGLSPVDPFRTPNLNKIIGNVGTVNRSDGPGGDIERLFGRAFAGKPV